MDHLESTTQQQDRRPAPRGNGRRRRTARENNGGDGADTDSRSQQSSNPVPTHDQQPARKSLKLPPRRRQPTNEPTPSSSAATDPTSPPPRPSRRAKFRATLTEASQAQVSASTEATSPPAEEQGPKPSARHKPRWRQDPPPADDLTSTLIHALRTPPYPDCPICFNAIRPEHPTWSCAPPTGIENFGGSSEPDKDADGSSQCCWNTFHLKCIRAWAEKSVKELKEAWRARGEPERPGEWHCPGCRATRQAVPQIYMCFCLRMRHPAPLRIATPHSCAQPCSRPRSTCGHACPLPCHPGPCPPCAVTVQVACFCGREKHSAKCQTRRSPMATSQSFSCAQPCRKPLQCGHSEHRCTEACHEGPCPPCPRQEEVRCWCGQETKRVACGEIKTEDTTKCIIIKDDSSEQAWIGSYGCGHPCERSFACSQHSCSKLCHPPSRSPPPCPFDPERVVSCACGYRRIARSFNEFASSSSFPASALLPPRTSCMSPLPTCSSLCSKPLPCGHLCQATCHWDPCPPCTEQVERTCRCGATKHKTACGDAALAPAREDILCDKPCQAQRSCGKHQCGRICCPLASLRRTTTKPPKQRDLHANLNFDADAQLLLTLDPALRALHECDLPCDRILVCGNHRCPLRDHKGPCPVCPNGVFQDLVCPCGRTVLEPPIQCGTRLECIYPCARPAPACGHPHVTHACHEKVVVAGADTADEGLGLVEEEEGERMCPPCPFLTEKVCACGKKQVGNVRCSQERVSCGSVCGKLLACGFHHCERLCHADACGTCTAVCGKPRKSCLPAHHPCTQTCHAPASCPETEPCLAPVTHTCPCGNLQSITPCSGTKLMLACTGDCEIKKRNARLAEALGISEERRDAKGTVTWSVELVGAARVLGPKFVGVVEKAFADFVMSSRRTQVLPHMPIERRKFVHDLASVYRMDTVMVDQEPYRSVQLIRRIDTRVPAPSLSQYMASSVTTGTTGRLVDLRSGKSVIAGGSAWGAGAGAGVGTSGGGGAGTGRWNVVAKSALGTPRSGGATPVRVPSPAGEGVGSREASPGASQVSLAGVGNAGGGTKSGMWMSPSVQIQRERERVGVVQAGAKLGVGVHVSAGAVQAEDVPDDWEDDA